MKRHLFVFAILLALIPAASLAGQTKILTNHLGYEPSGPKHAVILGQAGESISGCALKNNGNDQQVLAIPAKAAGPVQKWRDWYFWTLDFDSFTTEGKYYLECGSGSGPVRSFPFRVQRDLLERNTMQDAIYYFKDERSSGQYDKADRHLKFEGSKPGTVDAHGGWWDATGDYGKHFSHLSFSTYFNPQQIPLVVYSLLKSYEQTKLRGNKNFDRYQAHLLDEAMFGADYMVRMKVPGGSFYRSVSTGGVDQTPEGREIEGEMKRFGIEAAPGQGAKDMVESANNDLEYEVSYRSGGGIAIAALAMASTYPVSGDFSSADYLKAAEDSFDFLERENLKLTNDGKENIVDDYCGLAAATELYRATHQPKYKEAADRRAKSLMARQISADGYQNYWRADGKERPFFHASDGGFPVVSLLYYAEIADPGARREVLATVKKSLQFEFAITAEVNNPFGYSREYVQDKTGARRTSFFFPHNSDAAPWWQGENARLASVATAARLAERDFSADPEFRKQLEAFATNQLNWILGLNPFDSCMLNGVGRNNPPYMYFDSWEFTNAPGGISNGITSGFKDESDIDYLLPYRETGADNDWRWGEQWLPHSAWYLLAVASGGEAQGQ
ncbi:MAG TPA: glycoside hydrolase family 9 protein [Candidatus Sulfotelmatobacter sp.]|nr:glycoside hydrolase family 9 protein [Candidatus Sulfotelmatobacter sp.]